VLAAAVVINGGNRWNSVVVVFSGLVSILDLHNLLQISFVYPECRINTVAKNSISTLQRKGKNTVKQLKKLKEI